MLAGGAGVTAYTNCKVCHNSYPIGRDHDFAAGVCRDCARDKRVADAQDTGKTALADDLVRGRPRNSRDSDT